MKNIKNKMGKSRKGLFGILLVGILFISLGFAGAIADGVDDNLFIRLQKADAAKIEVPYSANPVYDNPDNRVCLSDFECIVPLVDMSPPQIDCPTDYNYHMISMNAPTGARVGEFDLYDYKVCCKRTDIDEPYCGDGVVGDDEDCDDDGTGPCIMTGPEKCSCPEGYRPEGFPLTGCVWEGAALVYWSEDNIGDFQLLEDPAVIVGDTVIYLIANDIIAVDGTTVEFEIYEKDIFNDDNIRTGDNKLISQYSLGKAVASWTVSVEDIENARQIGEGDSFEFYFTSTDSINGLSTSDDLDVTVVQEPICDTKERCMDYTTQTECQKDNCRVANNSIEGVDCSDPNINCECFWADNKCAPRWGNSDVGTCSYLEDTEDTCADMFLTYSWEAIWVNATPYLGDPQGLEALCVDGESTVPCPAQIQLSFFNYYNAIIVIVLIALIYFLIGLNKKKPKKRKVKKKKK